MPFDGGSARERDSARTTPMRIAIIVNMVAPYTTPLFAGLAERDDCELLVVSETPMERDRRWQPETDLPFEHVLLDSWTIDLSRLAVGSGFKTRFDTYMYVPKRPLAPLRRFSPDVVVASEEAGSGRRPPNIAALAARRRRGWAIVPWWGSFSREQADVAPSARRAVGQDVHALGRRVARVRNAARPRRGRAGRRSRPDRDRADHRARA